MIDNFFIVCSRQQQQKKLKTSNMYGFLEDTLYTLRVLSNEFLTCKSDTHLL